MLLAVEMAPAGGDRHRTGTACRFEIHVGITDVGGIAGANAESCAGAPDPVRRRLRSRNLVAADDCSEESREPGGGEENLGGGRAGARRYAEWQPLGELAQRLDQAGVDRHAAGKRSQPAVVRLELAVATGAPEQMHDDRRGWP